MAKMTDRELLRLALIDAASWQHELVTANGMDTTFGKIAAHRASLYRDLYNRRYGGMPDEAVRRARAEKASMAKMDKEGVR